MRIIGIMTIPIRVVIPIPPIIPMRLGRAWRYILNHGCRSDSGGDLAAGIDGVLHRTCCRHRFLAD